MMGSQCLALSRLMILISSLLTSPPESLPPPLPARPPRPALPPPRPPLAPPASLPPSPCPARSRTRCQPASNSCGLSHKQTMKQRVSSQELLASAGSSRHDHQTCFVCQHMSCHCRLDACITPLEGWLVPAYGCRCTSFCAFCTTHGHAIDGHQPCRLHSAASRSQKCVISKLEAQVADLG